MKPSRWMFPGCWLALAACETVMGQALPFRHKVEVYRDEPGEIMVFSLRLEQPFLAEEFEKSNFLRLTPLDENAYLIYPKEARFHQKHAAFFGRLRGSGKARLRLSYETVLENLDGSRRVETREGEVEVQIPTEEGGPRDVFLGWARAQNAYFLELLTYYPDDTFLEYCLLQSKDRYGVTPPKLPTAAPSATELDTGLYEAFTGSLVIQSALQRRALAIRPGTADAAVHVSQLAPPRLGSARYEELLRKKREQGVTPQVRPITRLIPEDQYLFHFESMQPISELLDLMHDWGGSVLRLFSPHARHTRLAEKLEEQLVLSRAGLEQLSANGAVAEIAITGSDLFVAEGTDVALIFRLAHPEAFAKTAEGWRRAARERHPGLIERELHYRGRKISACYSHDRLVSSFVVHHEDHVIYSNSDVTIRRIVDTIDGESGALHDAEDYQYVSTLLPPGEAPDSGYFFASEAFLRQQVGPSHKISEKRRLECFNNLVMLNNASLFYRLEEDRSPGSLTELADGRFVDPNRLVCPHGGVYAFDAEQDAATCSLHNGLRYLTPNAELEVLRVSRREQQEYEAYKERYAEWWQTLFNPIAVRIATQPSVKLEVCILPFDNGTLYDDLRNRLEKDPRSFDTARAPASTVASLSLVPGRERIGAYLRRVPGINDVLDEDPTLTDLRWLGDRLELSLCDADTILEIDPTQLHKLNLLGEISVLDQSFAAFALLATSLPTYVSIDVEDREKAQRFLDVLTAKVFLEKGDLLGLATRFDAYRLPDYREHANYVVSFQCYALKARLHVALIGDKLVAATKAATLRDVIDAAQGDAGPPTPPAHARLRLDLRALEHFKGDLRLYWAEKSRRACHANVMSIYSLVKLYRVPVDQIDRLSEAKYGVSYYCPEGGHYEYDAARDQVMCSLHGNRRYSKQDLGVTPKGSFSRLVEGLDEVSASLRWREDCAIATVEFVRRAEDTGRAEP